MSIFSMSTTGLLCWIWFCWSLLSLNYQFQKLNSVILECSVFFLWTLNLLFVCLPRVHFLSSGNTSSLLISSGPMVFSTIYMLIPGKSFLCLDSSPNIFSCISYMPFKVSTTHTELLISTCKILPFLAFISVDDKTIHLVLPKPKT